MSSQQGDESRKTDVGVKTRSQLKREKELLQVEDKGQKENKSVRKDARKKSKSPLLQRGKSKGKSVGRNRLA